MNERNSDDNSNLENDFTNMAIDLDAITRLRSSTWPLRRPEEFSECPLEPIDENGGGHLFESPAEPVLVRHLINFSSFLIIKNC